MLTGPECACPYIASTPPTTCPDDLLIRAYDSNSHLTCMGNSLVIFQLPLEQLLQIVEVSFFATGLIEILFLTAKLWLDTKQPMQSNPAKFALRTWAAVWACCQRGTRGEFRLYKSQSEQHRLATWHHYVTFDQINANLTTSKGPHKNIQNHAPRA